MADVLDESIPQNIKEKKEFLLRHDIALWDVLESCNIKGADDASIRDPKPNNIKLILKEAHIKVIYTTGKKVTALYKRLCYPFTNFNTIELPSTSPANCRTKYEDLLREYRKIREYC